MATIKVTTAKSGTGSLEEYLKQEHKTEKELITGKDCNPQEFAKDFEITRQIHNNTEGRQHYHFIQAFAPGETTPEQAHRIGCQLMEAKKFEGFQATCITHIDKNHIHNHIVINAVSQETGKKFHQTIKDLKEVKEFSNALCREHGLTEIDLEKKAKERYTMQECQLMEKGEKPWKELLREEIIRATYKAHSLEEFSQHLEKKGIEVKIQNKDLKYKAPGEERFCGGRQLGELYTRTSVERILSLPVEQEKIKEEIKKISYEISDINKLNQSFIDLKNGKKIAEEELEKLKKPVDYSMLEKISGKAKKSEELRAIEISKCEDKVKKYFTAVKQMEEKIKTVPTVEQLEKTRDNLSQKELALRTEREEKRKEINSIYREKEMGLGLSRERGLSR